jgi:hypothetical protein
MTWSNPLPLLLRVTEDSESFREFKGYETGLPTGAHPGAFGVQRKYHTHEGIDLYAPEGTAVMAVEAGTVVRVVPFTGPKAGLPWWLDTQAVFVEGASGVVVYGEIEAAVKEGDQVEAGAVLGRVVRVLAVDKGRPTCMLHLELHVHGSRSAPEWLEHDQRPLVLVDPTPFLLAMVKGQKEQNYYNPLLSADLDSDRMAEIVVSLLPGEGSGNQFIAARNRYLRHLPELEAGWLAGGGRISGETPSAEAAHCAVEVLERVTALPCKDTSWYIKGIITGPLPAGGVSHEIRWEGHCTAHVNIYNTGVVEVEIIAADVTKEFTSNFADAPSALVEQMQALA